MVKNDKKKCQKTINTFFCNLCDFQCSKKSNFTTHCLTAKHKIGINGNKKCQNAENKYECGCGKSYKYLSGLSRHKTSKSCPLVPSTQEDITNAAETKLAAIISETLTQAFKEMINENNNMLCKTLTSCNTQVNNSHNVNNSNNKTFNLQVFLNETCKDAMNITDFVNSIQLQLTDFENVGEQGYINGISNIIIKNLKALEENMRPVHCSDLKRESIYVKDNNTWEKDTNDNQKLKKAIKAIAHKNTKMIPKYKYPDSQISSSKASDNYNRFVIEAMGGAGDDDDEKTEKILKRIAKEIVIHKDCNQKC